MKVSDITSAYKKLTPTEKEKVSDYIQSLQNTERKKEIKKYRGFGSLKGQIIIHDDFDDPLADFEPYM